MNKNYFINLDNLGLYKTFGVNGDRSATELVSELNRFLITVRFVSLTERVALNIISRLEWYSNELSKSDADGTEEIIDYLNATIYKINGQRYIPSRWNEKGYKHHREKRLKRGETQAVELLEYIFSANENEDCWVPMSEPKNTKNTIEDFGVLNYLDRKSVVTEGQVSKPDSLTGDIKDIPQPTNSEFNLVGVLADLNETIRKMKRKLEDLEETVHYPKTFEIEGLVKE